MSGRMPMQLPDGISHETFHAQMETMHATMHSMMNDMMGQGMSGPMGQRPAKGR